MTSAQPAPEAITSRLLSGETLLWWGRPGQGLMFQPIDWFAIPFTLVWFGVIIFNVVFAARSHVSGEAWVFFVPFVLVGAVVLFGRYLLDAWLRSRMIYGLTDRRVLIARSGPLPSVKSFNLDGLPGIFVNERSGGRGTIRFGQQGPGWGSLSGANMGSFVAALDPTPQFLGIDDVQHVFAAIHGRTKRGSGA